MVVLCSRPPENVKLGSFLGGSATTANINVQNRQKSVTHVQSFVLIIRSRHAVVDVVA